MSECVFCEIVAGRLPAYRVLETQRVIAILDRFPLNDGHVLVIPKEHFTSVASLPLERLQELTSVAHRLSQAVQEEYRPSKVGWLIAGFDIAHLHLHVLPLEDIADVATRRVFHNEFVEADDRRLEKNRSRLLGRLSI